MERFFMMPVSPIKLDVNTERSCNNWKCCFNFRCWTNLNSHEEKQSSPISIQSVETITRTFEVHRTNRNYHSSAQINPFDGHRVSESLPKHLGSASQVETPQLIIEEFHVKHP